MSNIDKETIGTDIIVINSELSGLVTITSEDLVQRDLSNSFVYRIWPDGKILNVDQENNLDEKVKEDSKKTPKEILIEKLIKAGFVEISEELSELELVKLLDFSEREIVNIDGYARVFPFSVEAIHSGDLKVMLLIYNGATTEMTIEKFPFKLKDAKGKVIIAGLIDINKSVAPSKIAISEVQIEKSLLSEQAGDLTTWTVSFETE